MSSASPESVSVDVIRSSNNFDALRLTAAVAVIVGHAFVLTGRTPEVPTVLGMDVHVFGVAVFFAISGWLIAGSWERSRSVPQYVTSRALRILPLLFLVVLVSVFVMGPLVTTLSTREYFASSETWRYLVNLVMLPADGLAGVFTDVPYPGVVNGSVWTLRAEVICYAAVLGFGLLPRAARTAGYVALLAVSVVLAAGDVQVAGSSLSAAAGTWRYFVVAALLRLHLPRRLLRLDVAAVVVLVWALVAAVGGAEATGFASVVALPYVVLAVGLASWPVARHAARWGDLSYGMYLWAFPVQQLFIQYTGGIRPVALDVVAVVAVCAALSFTTWHLLEHPAMQARARLPWFRRPRLAETAAPVKPATS